MPFQVIHAARALLPEGWASDVRIEASQGLITAVTTNAPAAPGDVRVPVVVPGMANLHSHAFQRAMAGLTETRGPQGDHFWTWRAAMYRFAASMTPDDAEAIAAQAFVEMLESGFTRVGEFHYLHHQPGGKRYADVAEMAVRIAAAAQASGIGMTLLPVFYAHAGFGGAPAVAGQHRFLTTLDEYARLLEGSGSAIRELPGAVIGVAPHSLRAVSPEQLAAVVAMTNGPVHMHIAEQTAEVDASVAWSGARPMAWLLDHADVDARWCLVHATHMNAAETLRFARSKAVAGLCPITEANLEDGTFALTEFLVQGGRLGVGSDSNVMISLAGELRQLEYSQRLRHRARNLAAAMPGASTGRALFDAAVTGGAQALGMSCGLAPGAEADFVTLDVDHPTLVGRRDDQLLDAWIFGGGKVDKVWRRGRLLVRDGQHVARAEVARLFGAAVRRIQ
jgi:formiminoglutamate deiminase